MAEKVIDNKYLMIDAIKSEYPDINKQGIAAIMANVELESGGGRSGREKAYTLEQIYRKHTRKSAAEWNKKNPNKKPTSAGEYVQNIKSIRKNVEALGFGNPKDLSKEKLKEWNVKLKENPNSIIGVMYMGDFSATWAGGSGPLQLTISNYGGNQKKALALKQLAKDQGMEFNDYMEKFSSDPAFGLQETLKYYKSTGDRAWTTESLNATDAQTLGDTVINPHRKHLNDEKWQAYQAIGNDSIVDYNTNYLPTIIATPAPGDSTELTQEEKDQISKDIKPALGPLPGDVPTVLSQIEVDRNNAKLRKKEEEESKNKVLQPKELIPLADLSEEEIDALTNEQRQEYGLQPTVDVTDEKSTDEDIKSIQRQKEEKLEQEEKEQIEKYSRESIEKDRQQKETENKTVSKKEEEVVEKQELEKIEPIETEEMEVLDANGNIKKITVPRIQPVTPEKKEVVEEEVVEEEVKEVKEKVVKEEVVEEKPKLIKPKMRDFKNSTDYVKARMKYFKSVEDEENPGDDDELSDDEIKESVDMEQNSKVIDASKRNIFKVNGKNNIFSSIIGDIDTMAKGIQEDLNKFNKSLNNRD